MQQVYLEAIYTPAQTLTQVTSRNNTNQKTNQLPLFGCFGVSYARTLQAQMWGKIIIVRVRIYVYGKHERTWTCIRHWFIKVDITYKHERTWHIR